ncbi:MAG: hypothetical protein U0836_07555 [Pirellulales bacterium]
MLIGLEAALLALAFAMHYWVWRVEKPPPVDENERISQAFKIQYAKMHGDGITRCPWMPGDD